MCVCVDVGRLHKIGNSAISAPYISVNCLCSLVESKGELTSLDGYIRANVCQGGGGGGCVCVWTRARVRA